MRIYWEANYIKLIFCIIAAGVTLYFYIDKLNELTELRLIIPNVTKEVKVLKEGNLRLQYEIEQFESPIHLMELLRKPEFSHLHFPFTQDVMIIPEKKVEG